MSSPRTPKIVIALIALTLALTGCQNHNPCDAMPNPHKHAAACSTP